MKSVLMIGQSNMAGRGFIGDVEPITNERISMLRNGKWQMMFEPINYDRPVAGISLAATFADAWTQDHREDTLGLIPCAEGGSSLDKWRVDGVLFRHAIAQAKFAMETSELVGILWHQGEADSMNGLSKDYYEKLDVIITALRKELNVKDVPLIIGGLADFLGQGGMGRYCTEYKVVNEALLRFANHHDNTYFVTGEGLNANVDYVHIDAESLRRFGFRYYEAFRMQANVLTPLLNEDALVKHSAQRELSVNERIFLEGIKISNGLMDYDTYVKKCEALRNEAK